jgi:isopentenyl-diphosphate Delta-isomerase
MSKPRVIIVNEQDEIIGYKTRRELNAGDIDKIYRVSALWLTNSRGDILLAQRAPGKRHDPGKWGPAAAGTLEEGDTYDSNIAKEIEEELGLTSLTLTHGPKIRVSDRYNYFTQWYKAVIDLPIEAFRLQKEEVAAVKWLSPDELERALRDRPNDFLVGMERTVKELSK